MLELLLATPTCVSCPLSIQYICVQSLPCPHTKEEDHQKDRLELNHFCLEWSQVRPAKIPQTSYYLAPAVLICHSDCHCQVPHCSHFWKTRSSERTDGVSCLVIGVSEAKSQGWHIFLTDSNSLCISPLRQNHRDT